MPLQAVCPSCETSHKLADEKLGKKIRCKNCKEAFTVEAEEAAPPKKANSGVVEVACPHCEATLRLRPEMIGKKVRCKKCSEAFTAKTGDEDEEEDEDQEEKAETKVTAKAPKGKAAASKKKDDDDEDEDEEDEDEDEDEKSSKKGKKKKKQKGGSPVMMLSIAGGVGVLLIVVVVVVVMMMTGGGSTPTPVAVNDSSKKDDKKKTDDGKKIVNPPKGDKTPIVTDKKDDKGKPAVVISDPKDPVVINLKKLRLDIVTYQKEINSAITWFRDDPKKTKLNHPLRPEISNAFQLLVDHPEFKLFDDCWYCYTDWVTSDDAEVKQMEVHLTRAPKSLYRELMMKALARIKTEESCRVLATTFPSQEHALAVKLFKDIGPELGAKPVFPYVYYNDKYARDAAYALLKEYSEVEPKEIKNGVVVKQYKKGEILKDKIGYKTIDEIPRLPVSKHELSLEKAIEDIKGGETTGEGVKVEDRLQKLAAIGYLQKQLLNPGQWEAVSKVLDPFITDRKDQFMRTNALIALERWVHKQNIANLCTGIVTPQLKDDHFLMLTTLIKVPDKESGKAVVQLYVDLKFYPEYRKVLEDFLLKLGDEDAQRELLKLFNKFPGIARQGVLKFQKENKRISNDDIIDQCAMDIGGEDPVKIAALNWLKTYTFHSDRKRRFEIEEQLIPISKMEITKDTKPVDAEVIRLAGAVLANIRAKMSAAGVN